MTTSLILALLWLITANVLAMIPSKDNLWFRAYVLIAVGIPLVGYVTYENGPIWGLVILAGGISVLRWPLVYLTRWLRRKSARGEETSEI